MEPLWINFLLIIALYLTVLFIITKKKMTKEFTKEEIEGRRKDPLNLIRTQAYYLSSCIQTKSVHDDNFKKSVHKQFETIRKTLDELEQLYDE